MTPKFSASTNTKKKDPFGRRNNTKCAQCGQKFLSNNALKTHLQTHLVDRVKFKCSVDQCFKQYYSRQKLKLHVQKVHLGTFKRFECSFCDSTFMSKTGRDSHIVAAHTLEKSFQCKVCPFKFSTASLLLQHGMVHADAKPHKCRICFKQYKRSGHLSQHINVHTKRSRDFECSICKKTFFTKPELNVHEKIHGPDADKSGCYFCQKRFTLRSNLVDHTRTHTQEKPFLCSVDSCQYSSSLSSNLKRHTKKRHNPVESGLQFQSQTWSCYFCSKIFAQLNSLADHLRIHTLEEPFSCGLCQKSFKSVYSLKCHIPTHTMEKPFIKCDECQKCFFSRSNLQSHFATTHRVDKYLLK